MAKFILAKIWLILWIISVAQTAHLLSKILREKKERILRNQEERHRDEDEKEKLRITHMTNVEEPTAPEETGISSSRLKSYGL